MAYSNTFLPPNFLTSTHLPTTSCLVRLEVVHVGLCVAPLLLLLPGLGTDPGVVQGLFGCHSLPDGGGKKNMLTFTKNTHHSTDIPFIQLCANQPLKYGKSFCHTPLGQQFPNFSSHVPPSRVRPSLHRPSLFEYTQACLIVPVCPSLSSNSTALINTIFQHPASTYLASFTKRLQMKFLARSEVLAK